MQTEPINKAIEKGTKVAEQLKYFSEFAKQSLEDNPNFMPMLHCFTEDDKVIVIGCPFDGPGAKQNFFEKTGPMLLAYHKVKAFIFGCESWIKKTDKESYENRKYESLEDDPDAESCLICIYVSEDGDVMQNIMPVMNIKNSKGETIKSTVGEGKWDDQHQIEGRIPEMMNIAKGIHPTMAKMFIKLSQKTGPDDLVFTKEDRVEITEYIKELSEKGELPEWLYSGLKEASKAMEEESQSVPEDN